MRMSLPLDGNRIFGAFERVFRLWRAMDAADTDFQQGPDDTI